MDQQEFNDKITTARGCMVMDAPYFASLAFGLGILKSKGKCMPTVDGRVFDFSEDYIENISKEHLKGVIAAASLACGLGHPFRIQGRDKGLWSKASCMITGPAVTEAGFELPLDWPLDGRFGADTAIEDAYRILEEEAVDDKGEGDDETDDETEGGGGGGGGAGAGGKGGGKGKEPNEGDDDKDQGDGEGGVNVNPPKNDPGDKGKDQPKDQPHGGGDDREGDDQDDPDDDDGDGDEDRDQRQTASPDKQRQMEQEWNVKMIQAAQSAQKSCGNIPGWMRGIIDQITKPKVDWRAVLRQFLEETSKDDYSFLRRSRRFSTDEWNFPGLWSEDKPRLIVAMDYSGSVSKNERVQFLSELNSILEEFDIKITVIYFDSSIQQVKEYSREDLPIQDDSGYGGTYFPVPFEYIEENIEEKPTAMIVCSDMECGSFPDEPPFPVLWVSTQPIKNVERYWPDNEIPFGTVLEIDVPHGGR